LIGQAEGPAGEVGSSLHAGWLVSSLSLTGYAEMPLHRAGGG
jgi:hypothetical protein